MEEEHEATATEVVMKTMEDFAESEAKSIMILYTNEDDDVICQSNMRRVEALGMLELAKFMILRRKEDE